MTLSLKETLESLPADKISELRAACADMSNDFTKYQVPFATELMSLEDILIAAELVDDLGMQAEIDYGKVQRILFDTTSGLLVTGVLQQPLFVVKCEGLLYLCSGRHRATALKTLVQYGLDPQTLVNVLVFVTESMELAMQIVLTSNGSRAVTKGENSSFKLAQYGVKADANDCISAGRDGRITQSEAFLNACWFSYDDQTIGDRSISTVHSIAKSFYGSLKKMHYSYEQIITVMDDMLFNIEDASQLSGRTDVQRGSTVVVSALIELLGLLPKESQSIKQAKTAVKMTLFSKSLR